MRLLGDMGKGRTACRVRLAGYCIQHYYSLALLGFEEYVLISAF